MPDARARCKGVFARGGDHSGTGAICSPDKTERVTISQQRGLFRDDKLRGDHSSIQAWSAYDCASSCCNLFCLFGTGNGGLRSERNGCLVFELYFGWANRNANPDMASTGKAFYSIACDNLLDDCRIKIPDGLTKNVFTAKFLPQALPLNDPGKADITLGQHLFMSPM